MRIQLFFLFIIAILFLSACQTGTRASPEFVSCLEEQNVKMYGAFWCGHCADQKALLGKVDTIYIECDARGKNEQSELCIEKGIEGYPTFELGNGSFISGVHTVEELSNITGCQID